MTTRLELDDELIRRTKDEAARRGTSFDEFVAQTLREKVLSSASDQQAIVLPTHDLGGPKPDVDLDNGRALRDSLDENGLARY